MNIESRTVINVPQAYLFSFLTDLDFLEQNLPTNITMRAKNEIFEISQGSEWIVKANRKGRNFKIDCKVETLSPYSLIKVTSETNRSISSSNIKIKKLADEQSELHFLIKVEGKGIMGRILMQTVKAARERINSGFVRNTERFKQKIEAAYLEGR